jgi:hypothetical protein
MEEGYLNHGKTRAARGCNRVSRASDRFVVDKMKEMGPHTCMFEHEVLS